MTKYQIASYLTVLCLGVCVLQEGRSALAIALQASFTEMADLLKAHMAS